MIGTSAIYPLGYIQCVQYNPSINRNKYNSLPTTEACYTSSPSYAPGSPTPRPTPQPSSTPIVFALPFGNTGTVDDDYMGSFNGLLCCNNNPNVIIASSVTSLSSGAFHGCRYLRSIIIPSSVTLLGNGVFKNCVNLQSVTIPTSITIIPSSTFRGSGITSIVIPTSVVTIMDGAFALVSLRLLYHQV